MGVFLTVGFRAARPLDTRTTNKYTTSIGIGQATTTASFKAKIWIYSTPSERIYSHSHELISICRPFCLQGLKLAGATLAMCG